MQLWGINHGWLGPPRGLYGYPLLGRQTRRALGTPAGGTDSFKTRFSPNIADGDIYCIGMVTTPGNFPLTINDDGTYRFFAGGGGARQVVPANAYAIATGLYGEGTMAVNDSAPVPTLPYFNNGTWAVGQSVNIQLSATDPNGDTISYSLSGGAFPPGWSMSSSGQVTGSSTTLGSYGVNIKVSDPYGVFTTVVDSINIALVLPNFSGQQLGQAQAAITALGLGYSSSSIPSGAPVNQVMSQTPPPGTVVTSAITVALVVSDGSLSTGNPNVFPNNILGLTWNGTRTTLWRTGYQESLTGVTTTYAYQQFPIVEWQLDYELLNQVAAIDDLKKIAGLFSSVQGQNGTFLYEDPAFNTANPSGEVFATSDGSTASYQLVARYTDTGGPTVPEIIQNVQPSPAVQIYDNGTVISSANYTISAVGVVTFGAGHIPASGHVLTWTGKFYYRCRFELDDLDPNQFMVNFWSLKTLKFRSVIL